MQLSGGCWAVAGVYWYVYWGVYYYYWSEKMTVLHASPGQVSGPALPGPGPCWSPALSQPVNCDPPPGTVALSQGADTTPHRVLAEAGRRGRPGGEVSKY